jgi:hypothetical protein
MDLLRDLPGFASKNNNQFRLTFENGLSLSICWSRNCYCDRYEFGVDQAQDLKEDTVHSPNAEIAISHAGTLMNWGNDTVLEKVGPSDLARIIPFVQAAEPESESLVRLRLLGLATKPHHKIGILESIRVKMVETGYAVEPTGSDLDFEP